VITELKEAVRSLKKRHPGVQAVYLFGSFASGVPTPKSDADLLIVSNEKDLEAIQTMFYSVSIPIDFFIVNPETFERKTLKGEGIFGAAVNKGLRLL
jgi:predicted nucleotidyltransferase